MPTQNREKVTPPPCPQNVCTGSTPSPCGHTLNFKKSEVFALKGADDGRQHLKKPPCLKNVRAGQTPSPLTADVFYEQSLTVPSEDFMRYTISFF